FVEDSKIFKDLDEKEKCLSILKSYGHEITQNNSLVLFEKLIPVQSLHILWQEKERFTPLIKANYIYNKAERIQIEHISNNLLIEKNLEDYGKLQERMSELEAWLRDIVADVLNSEIGLG